MFYSVLSLDQLIKRWGFSRKERSIWLLLLTEIFVHQVSWQQQTSWFLSKNKAKNMQGAVYSHAFFLKCVLGDTLTSFAKICNTSSKSMKPKFSVLKRTSYHAGGSTNSSYETVFKCVGDTIEPNSEATSSCNIGIPTSAIYNINNCEIISVDYILKVGK